MLKSALLLAVLFLLFFLSGCVEQPISEVPEFMEGDENAPVGYIPFDEDFAEGLISTAPIPGNCEEMPTEFGKQDCIFSESVEENNVEGCLGLTALDELNNCISLVASQQQDTSICSNMKSAFSNDNTNVKYSCSGFVAKDNDDESYCSRIPDSAWREVCIKGVAIERSDTEMCLTLHGFEKDTCLLEVGGALAKNEVCEQIADPIIVQQCLERVQDRLATSGPIGA